MDREGFDRIARMLGTSGTRRSGLRALVGGMLGLGLGETARASKPGKGRDARKKDGPTPERGPSIQGPCGNGRRKDNICTKDSECCTGICNKRLGKHNTDGKGRCRCMKRGQQCRYDRNCCGTLQCRQGECAEQGPGPGPDAPIPTGSPCTPQDTCAAQAATCRTYTSGDPVGLYCLLPNGQNCSGANDCADQSCINGTCAQTTVIPTGDACTQQDTCADAQAACVVYTSSDPSGTYCLLSLGGSCDGSEECVSQLCVAGVCTVTAETCDVCANCTYQTIQAAITGMAEGSTIKIGEGAYTEDLTIDKDLTLRACNGEPVSIQNATLSGRVIQRQDNSGDPVALTITDITIDRNAGHQLGGGIFGYFNLTLNGTTIIQNSRGGEAGGGVELGDGSPPWEYGQAPLPCTFIMEGEAAVRSNIAGGYGGGVWFGCRGGEAIIRGSASVTSNSSGEWGGGIALADDTTLTVTGDATILGNYSDYRGGGFMCVIDCDVILSGNASLKKNRADSDGGGGMIYDVGTVTMSGNARIEDNVVGEAGGGLDLYEDGTLTMNDDSAIRGNSAVYGSGAFVYHYDPSHEDLCVIMNDRAVIEDNNADLGDNPYGWHGGGGIFVTGGGSTRLNDSSAIRNNTTNGNGGGVHAEGNVVLRDTSSIEGNHADGAGGGIYLERSSATATVGANATLANNTPNDCDGNGTC